MSDLDALAASTMGKVEIESFEEGREGDIVEKLLRQAVLTVFRERVGTGAAAPVRRQLRRRRGAPRGRGRHRRADYQPTSTAGPAWPSWSTSWPATARRPPTRASAAELVLEGLHLSKRLNKDAVGARATYRAR